MTYQEFRKEYKSVLQKHYETSNLYNMEGITEKVERFLKRGSRWVLVESTEKSVSYEFYFNVFSSIQFMKNLGGYERTEKSYTTKGYIPTRQISISPDRTKKTVFSFSFEKAKYIE